MSKVLRHHNIGETVINGWGPIAQGYNDHTIENINDPAGATAAKEITSVPSPFARLALTINAFKIVCKDATADNQAVCGTSIHHKTISHCLDIAQIFFTFDTQSAAGKVELISWEKNVSVNRLTASRLHGHKLLGNTLHLYLQQDAAPNNFDRLNAIYLLRYKGPGMTDQMEIIGATAPRTLFVSSANNMDVIGRSFTFGHHVALQNKNFKALHERDEAFILWFYALRSDIPDFAALFPEVNNYLDICFGLLPYDLQTRIYGLNPGDYAANYDSVSLGAGVPVEILGYPLLQQKPVDIAATSDFAITDSKYAGSKKPLILPQGQFAMPWRYTIHTWNSSTRVGTPVTDDLDARILPDDGTKWPYLTIDDLLDTTIIQTGKYAVYGKNFFNGGLPDNAQGGYLLPVKERYFEFFTADDLRRHIRIAEMPKNGGGTYVKVTLTLPVRKGSITYERSYFEEGSVIDGGGTIVNHRFSLALYPGIKFPAGVTPDYRIHLLAQRKEELALDFIDENGNTVAPHQQDDRNDKSSKPQMTTIPMPIWAIRGAFERIAVRTSNAKGFLLPEWGVCNGGQAFEFAVDFGTTNTHIEYSVAGSMAKPFDLAPSPSSFLLLNRYATEDPDCKLALLRTAVPFSNAPTDEVHFPLRSVLSYKQGTNWQAAFSPYVTGNLPFYYGRTSRGAMNEYDNDLKWSTANGARERAECYLASLMLAMRNKVICDGGDLAQTNLKWFYPTSMPTTQVASLQTIWGNLYTTYFGNPTGKITSIPESVAPYHYYKAGLGMATDVLTVDIGGGTSDAVVVGTNQQVSSITSFRFAANALFGDGFKKQYCKNANNAFVNKFQNDIEQKLDANGLGNITQVLKEMKETQYSTDVISYFFSLKDNAEIKAKNISIDFNDMLRQNQGACTLALLFYTSIVYHMAQYINGRKAAGENVREPACIAFSGNGSKILQILGINTAAGKDALTEYTKAVFCKVMGCTYENHSLILHIDAQRPKEATSAGGLQITPADGYTPSFISKNKHTLLNGKNTRFATVDDTYDKLTGAHFKELEEDIKNFTKIFFELAKEQDAENNFGCLPLNDLRSHERMFTNDIDTITRNALSFYGIQPGVTTSAVDSPLFFYKITSLINELAAKIV